MKKSIRTIGFILLVVCSLFAAKKVYNHVIDQDLCNQCGDCVKSCKENAIKVIKTKDGKIRHEIDPALCTQCGICVDHCKLGAIEANEVKPVKK